jgi:molybdate transport system regulatory protein
MGMRLCAKTRRAQDGDNPSVKRRTSPSTDLVRFRLDLSRACSIGPGKIALLEAIAHTGSLREAARQLKMSYRRAWLLLDDVNHSFRVPVSEMSVGGAGGGGARLTPFGVELVRRYRATARRIEVAARANFAGIARKAAATRGRRRAGPRRRATP